MKTILLIEDNPDIRDNAAEILELSNYKVLVAENGKVGLEMALQHVPDLILCDIMMPVLDGYGVLHALQKNEHTRNTPFIFLTAKTERMDYRKSMEMGADDFITKPFTGTELLSAVDGRLKKITAIKEEISSGIEQLNDLVSSLSGEEELNNLKEGRNVNRYKKKQLVYTEGNHPSRLYYVLKGKVKTFKRNDDGKELVMELYGPGDFLGYVALLESSPYKDTAEAMEETELAIIPREEFDSLLNRNVEVARKFIQLLARNVSEKENQLLGLAYNSLRKKVADALLMLRRKYTAENRDGNFIIEINREVLATIAGTATESLIRTLSDFRHERLIEINEGMITIMNPRKLEDMVN